MKIKLNLETIIYIAVILLSLIALVFGFSSFQFTDTKLVYQGF